MFANSQSSFRKSGRRAYLHGYTGLKRVFYRCVFGTFFPKGRRALKAVSFTPCSFRCTLSIWLKIVREYFFHSLDELVPWISSPFSPAPLKNKRCTYQVRTCLSKLRSIDELEVLRIAKTFRTLLDEKDSVNAWYLGAHGVHVESGSCDYAGLEGIDCVASAIEACHCTAI